MVQTSATLPTCATLDWGRTRYEAAQGMQNALVSQRIAGAMGDTLVFTEHEPVFTLGLRRGSEQNLVWDEAQLAQQGVEVVKTNRGGDITYHGPGQVVGYPIVSLAPRPDLHAYLRFLEQVLINSVGALGLAATRRDGKTGIWLGPRKISAADGTVTSLSAELGRKVDPAEVKAVLTREFWQLWPEFLRESADAGSKPNSA